jgi:hypothetical protein
VLAQQQYQLTGAVVERSGHGYHIIAKAPPGDGWKRRIWGAPHPVCEARCGRDNAGNGLLLFVTPSWHPIAQRFYERKGPLVPVTALPECPRELLEHISDAPKLARNATRLPAAQRAGRGDWRTLDVVALFTNAGMYVAEHHDRKHGVRCPWESTHSTGSDGTDTVVFEARGGKGPGFQCMHAHCADRTMRDVREFFGPDVVDRFCTADFRPHRFANDSAHPVRAAWATHLERAVSHDISDQGRLV